MTGRDSYKEKIRHKVQNKKLVWIGTRACDALALKNLSDDIAAFGFVSPTRDSQLRDYTLESISKSRMDFARYDPAQDQSEHLRTMQQQLVSELSTDNILLVAQPQLFIDAAYILNQQHTKLAGNFSAFQSCFNSKTWVESEVRKLGIKTIPWKYLLPTAKHFDEVAAAAEQGALVLRSNRSAGGTGVTRIDHPEQLKAAWNRLSPKSTEPIAYSTYLHGSIPISVSATLFSDGALSLHPVSLQCIGAPELTKLNSGYIGNDFGILKELAPTHIGKIEEMLHTTARWLFSKGYKGSFGLDALIHQDDLLFIEINPRFQGSTAMAARVDKLIGRPDTFMTHLAAFLELPPPPQTSLQEIVAQQPQVGQMVFENHTSNPIRLKPPHPRFDMPPFEHVLKPDPGITIAPGGYLATLNCTQPLLNLNGSLNSYAKEVAKDFRLALTLDPQTTFLGAHEYLIK